MLPPLGACLIEATVGQTLLFGADKLIQYSIVTTDFYLHNFFLTFNMINFLISTAPHFNLCTPSTKLTYFMVVDYWMYRQRLVPILNDSAIGHFLICVTFVPNGRTSIFS